jgi:hypothetical protein
MAFSNPLFSTVVEQALARLASDVARGAFDVIELPEA